MSNADSDLEPGNRIQTEPLEYRAVSGLAIAAFLLGLLSSTATVSLVLWGVPLAGAITSIVALARIDRSAGALTGRGAALGGLVLSVFFGTVAPAHFVSTERLLNNRAEQVAQQWFAALAHDEPQIAHQLGSAAATRARTSDPVQLWNYYRNIADRRRDLERFVAEPLIRTLLALDGQATVRLYDTRGVSVADQQSIVTQTYAVTFKQDGARKTFFVGLTLERSLQRGTDKVDWRVAKYAGGVDPD